MSFLFTLPKYPLLSFLSSWLTTRALGRIDSALCNELQRTCLLELISCQDGLSLQGGTRHYSAKRDNRFLKWIKLRNAQLSQILLRISRDSTVDDMDYYCEIVHRNISKFKSLAVVFYMRHEDFSCSDEHDTFVENSGPYNYPKSNSENGLLNLINSSSQLRSLQVNCGEGSTLMQVNSSVLNNLTSIELHDSYIEEDRFDSNADLGLLLTSKCVDFLAVHCHNLITLRIESAYYFCSDLAMHKLAYNSRDVTRLIRSNPQLQCVQFGLDKEDSSCNTDQLVMRAIAETCTDLRILISFDCTEIKLTTLVDIFNHNPHLTKVVLSDWNGDVTKEFAYSCIADIRGGEWFRSLTVNRLCTVERGGGDGDAVSVQSGGGGDTMKEEENGLNFFLSRVSVAFHKVVLMNLSDNAVCSYMSDEDDDDYSPRCADVTDEDLLLIAQRNTALCAFHIVNCGASFTSHGMRSLITLCALKTVELGACNHLGNSDFLAVFCTHGVTNSLTHLYITRHNKITEETLWVIAQRCHSLAKMTLEDCVLTTIVVDNRVNIHTQRYSKCEVEVSGGHIESIITEHDLKEMNKRCRESWRS